MKARLFVVFLIFISGLLLSSCGSDGLTQDTSEPTLESVITDSLPTPTQTQVLPTSTQLPSPTATALPPTPTPYIPMPKMGVEAHQPEKEEVIRLLNDSGAQIVRYGSVIWYKVEPQEGQYDWAALEKIDAALREMSAQDFEVILIVRGTPEWAQKVPGAACGPISVEKLSNFAVFMTMLVQRYSVPPYDVKYWEIGNEPDVAPELVAADSGFGCWGDSQNPYYGGGYYADMLKVVYPAIKSVDPEAQVLIGGLLLDCDPYNPPEGKDCLSSRFLNGILGNGGADYFDYVNFHGYPFYHEQSLHMEWETPGWEKRGGVVAGKIDYLREVMAQYSVDKPIILTESALTCPEWNQVDCAPPDEGFFDTQADYVVRLFVRNWALDVSSTIWYSFEGEGWRYGGLVGSDANNPKPAYRAFQYMNDKLRDLTWVGEAHYPSGVEGHIFSGSDYQTWVVWSQDESPQTIDLPPNLLSIYDKFGQEVSADGSQITVTSPQYFDVVP